MGHGGVRKGAGRKNGSVNKLDQEAREKAAAEGIMPLEYILSIMRNEELDRNERFNAAVAAAPYCHAKLASIEQNDSKDAPLAVQIIELKVDPVTKQVDTAALPSLSMDRVAERD